MTKTNANENKMTRRDFFNAIARGEALTAEMQEFATAEIAKLDADNEKRRAKNLEKKAEDAPKLELLARHLTSEPKTATDLHELVECSTQKTTSLLKNLVEAGKAKQVDVKITGKGNRKGYVIVG